MRQRVDPDQVKFLATPSPAFRTDHILVEHRLEKKKQKAERAEGPLSRAENLATFTFRFEVYK